MPRLVAQLAERGTRAAVVLTTGLDTAREPGGRVTRFVMRDSTGAHTYPVVYRGITPDTFTDEVDVVVEGRLGQDGTFQATTLLAKCASRYENAPERPGYGAPGDAPPPAAPQRVSRS